MCVCVFVCVCVCLCVCVCVCVYVCVCMCVFGLEEDREGKRVSATDVIVRRCTDVYLCRV